MGVVSVGRKAWSFLITDGLLDALLLGSNSQDTRSNDGLRGSLLYIG